MTSDCDVCEIDLIMQMSFLKAVLLSAPSASTVLRWFNRFSLGNSAVQDIKGKTKNKTKCNEKLIGRVKAVVDENVQITI